MKNKIKEYYNDLVKIFLKKEEEIRKDFEYSVIVNVNILGVSEHRFLAKGTCLNCGEETNALVIIPHMPDDVDKPKNLRAICDKCNKEFTISKE